MKALAGAKSPWHANDDIEPERAGSSAPEPQ